MRQTLSIVGSSSILLLLAFANLRCGDVLAEARGPADASPNNDPDAAIDSAADAGPDPFAVSDHYVDGTRLRASMFVTTEGARQFRGWYDTTLGKVCDFVQHVDGKLRCVPRGTNDTPIYSAAGCAETTRVVFRSACDEVPKFARQQVSLGGGECEPRYRAYRVGNAVAASGYYSRNTESAPCPPDVKPLKPGEELRARGEELAAADLVEGKEVDWTPPSASGPPPVRVVFIEGADGSKGFHALREAYKAETCELRSASTLDPTIRCIPTRTLLNLDYTDPTCTMPAFGSYAGQACARPAFGKVFASSADACQTNEDFYVLASQSTPEAYRKIAGGCTALTLDAGTYGGTLYLAGTPYGLSNFAAATPVPLRSDRRVDQLKYALPDGTKVPRGYADFGRWRDQQRNEDCEFRVAADGKVRCVPVAQASVSVASNYFSDAQCQVPVAIAVPNGCERPVKVVAVAVPGADGCATNHVHAVGAAVTTDLWRIARAGQPCTLSVPDPNAPKYYVGAEILPTDLAEATPTIP